MAKKAKRIGFTRDELNTSTGFLDDVDVKFTECKFLVTDYGGKAPRSVVFQTTFIDLETENPYDQMFKVSGGPEDWDLEPTGDDELVPLTPKAEKGVHVTCKFGQLVESLLNAGIPDQFMDGVASSWDDMEAHVIRIENKNAMKDKATGQKRKDEVLIVDKILRFPDGSVPGDATPATKKTTKKAAPAVEKEAESEGDESDDAAEKFVQAVLKEKGEVAKKDLPKLAFSMIKDEDERNAVLELVFSDEYLKDKARPWNYANGIISS